MVKHKDLLMQSQNHIIQRLILTD